LSSAVSLEMVSLSPARGSRTRAIASCSSGGQGSHALDGLFQKFCHGSTVSQARASYNVIVTFRSQHPHCGQKTKRGGHPPLRSFIVESRLHRVGDLGRVGALGLLLDDLLVEQRLGGAL